MQRKSDRPIDAFPASAKLARGFSRFNLSRMAKWQTDAAEWQGGERYKMQNSSPQREQGPRSMT
jgi:hypothetical protein